MALISPLLLPRADPERQFSPSPPSPKQRFAATAPRVCAEAEQGETLFGTALKIITCGLGSGILVMPWGAAGASLMMSHIMTAVVLVANAWTIMIIVYAIDCWGGTKQWDDRQGRWMGSHRRTGYRIDDLGQLLRQAPWPLPGLACVWDATVNISNFGALVGYMIVTGDAMKPLMSAGCNDLADRKPWIILGSLVCLPLCWADLSFLKYSCAVGIAANVYLFFVLMRVFVSQGISQDVCMFGTSPGTLTCMSNLVFTVVLQMCIPEYYTHLRRDDQNPSKFMWHAVMPSFGFIFVLVCAFSTVGYTVFGETVSANVLTNLPEDAVGKSTQVAICIACLMVYPCMLRPMLQPWLRTAEWLSSLKLGRRIWPISDDESAADATEKPNQNIYEGRLVHTELQGPIQVDLDSGEATLDVDDTCGFERDSLIFIDGATREYAVVKEVLRGPYSPSFPRDGTPGHRLPRRCGRLRLRPRFGAEAQLPVLNSAGIPSCAFQSLVLPAKTKVVLDEDPVLVTAAVAGERCLHMSFITGLTTGTRIVVGEGERAEHHIVVDTGAFEPEKESTELHVRTHDLVLFLGKDLKYNHGAHTRVVLDHGPTEVMATVIVGAVLIVALSVDNLGFVNSANGALSTSIIVGLVPGICALTLNSEWVRTRDEFPFKHDELPLCFRHRSILMVFIALSVIVGVVGMFYTDNHASEMVSRCWWYL